MDMGDVDEGVYENDQRFLLKRTTVHEIGTPYHSLNDRGAGSNGSFKNSENCPAIDPNYKSPYNSGNLDLNILSNVRLGNGMDNGFSKSKNVMGTKSLNFDSPMLMVQDPDAPQVAPAKNKWTILEHNIKGLENIPEYDDSEYLAGDTPMNLRATMPVIQVQTPDKRAHDRMSLQLERLRTIDSELVVPSDTDQKRNSPKPKPVLVAYSVWDNQNQETGLGSTGKKSNFNALFAQDNTLSGNKSINNNLQG
jgi:hypothetical protein